MALSFEQKKAVVEEVAEVARSAHSAVAAEYRGLTVAKMTELREKAKQSGVYLRVVRNTLARRAVEGTEFECVRDRLRGPLVLAFSREEPGAAARVVRDYAKGNDKVDRQLLWRSMARRWTPRRSTSSPVSRRVKRLGQAGVGAPRAGDQARSHTVARASCRPRPCRGRDARGSTGSLIQHSTRPDRPKSNLIGSG